MCTCPMYFFFNDTATTEIYTLSLHDALPIWPVRWSVSVEIFDPGQLMALYDTTTGDDDLSLRTSELLPAVHGFLSNIDRKSTRLNSSHANISYAVFCLKKKNSQNGNLQSRTT